MPWIVLLVIAGLSCAACGWITFHKSQERVTVSFEIDRFKQAVFELRAKGKELLEQARER